MLNDRSSWNYALTGCPGDEVTSLIEEISKHYSCQFKALPQSGLAMIKLRDSAFHEPYFLGEIPLSSAWVVLTQKDGTVIEGAAQIMDDDPALASSLAIADAILANQAPGWQSLQEKLRIGMQHREQQNHIRKEMLAKTAVDFSLLNTTGQDNDD